MGVQQEVEALPTFPADEASISAPRMALSARLEIMLFSLESVDGPRIRTRRGRSLSRERGRAAGMQLNRGAIGRIGVGRKDHSLDPSGRTLRGVDHWTSDIKIDAKGSLVRVDNSNRARCRSLDFALARRTGFATALERVRCQALSRATTVRCRLRRATRLGLLRADHGLATRHFALAAEASNRRSRNAHRQ